MCHGHSWTPMDLAAQRLRDKAWRKRCAARLEASCPWIVHVSSMVYTRPPKLLYSLQCGGHCLAVLTMFSSGHESKISCHGVKSRRQQHLDTYTRMWLQGTSPRHLPGSATLCMATKTSHSWPIKNYRNSRRENTIPYESKKKGKKKKFHGI